MVLSSRTIKLVSVVLISVVFLFLLSRSSLPERLTNHLFDECYRRNSPWITCVVQPYVLTNERRRLKAVVGDTFTLRQDGRGMGPRRGVVIVGGTGPGSSDYTLDALLAIKSLRLVGCTLPVELWHNDDARLALDGEKRHMVANLTNVTLRSLPTDLRGYQFKSRALMLSSFQDILYMDADNTALVDPTPFFSLDEYLSTGAVLWPDFTTVNFRAALWDIIEKQPLPMMSHESGQMLINRKKHAKTLALADYFNTRGPEFYYNLAPGDADLFLFAWLALGAPFHMTQTLVASVGYMGDPRTFCGHTMLQFHPDGSGQAVFAHRNLLKWSTSPGDTEVRWRDIKRAWYLSQEQMMHSAKHGTSKGYSITTWLESEACLCNDGRVKGCVDMDYGLNQSSSANITLQGLEALEKELLMLRSSVVDPTGKMRTSWLSSWIRSVSGHDIGDNESLRDAGSEL